MKTIRLVTRDVFEKYTPVMTVVNSWKSKKNKYHLPFFDSFHNFVFLGRAGPKINNPGHTYLNSQTFFWPHENVTIMSGDSKLLKYFEL